MLNFGRVVFLGRIPLLLILPTRSGFDDVKNPARSKKFVLIKARAEKRLFKNQRNHCHVDSE